MCDNMHYSVQIFAKSTTNKNPNWMEKGKNLNEVHVLSPLHSYES